MSLQLSMLQLGSVSRPWSGHLVATSSNKQFLPVGPWMPALSALKFQPTLIVSDIGGNLEINFTYRTAATSPETPDPWNTSGLLTPITMNSEANYGEQAPTLTNKMWVQPGLYYDVTSGTLGQADVSVLLGVRHTT